MVTELEFREGDMTKTQRRVWLHVYGDLYVPVSPSIVGNGESGFEHVWSQLDQAHGLLSAAIKAGLRAKGSDDFNLAVMRKGHVIALLWMTEVIDQEPDVLVAVEQVINT